MAYRPEWLSEGVEVLMAEVAARDAQVQAGQRDDLRDFDVVVIGSGYGGSVAAARLSGARTNDGRPLAVCVLERGREYVPGSFPARFADVPGHVRFSRTDEAEARGAADALYDFRFGGEVSALLGNGLGGGSLINAGVAERAPDGVFGDPRWPAALRADAAAGLGDGYARAEAMLGVRPAPTGFAKHQALRRLAERSGLALRAANIAVNGGDVVNPQGVHQRACVSCGDCVTGCNAWAKNTLAMNYLAEAKNRGARLFTGAIVSRLARGEHVDRGWEVYVRPTIESHPPREPRECVVRARHVIVAAGAYGSTELLLRSRARGLPLSHRLGTRASANGDMISVLYGEDGEVNAAAQDTTAPEARQVGPTITGLVEAQGSDGRRIVVEELAIPGALRRVFEEIVTTGALPVRLAIADRDEHGPDGADMEAVDPDRIRRSQVFAAMGDDGAQGTFELAPGWDAAKGDGVVRLLWPEAGRHDLYEEQDRLLSRACERVGGLYLRSPLWRPLPEALARMLSGPKPEGKLFSVHPLGGCPMGDSVDVGVVDHMGRVFDPRGDGQVHDGLLVLDGSIVPMALGINPLLTISAVAERAVARYAAHRGWALDYEPAPCALPPVPDDVSAPPPAQASATAVRFAEKMSGALRYVRGTAPLESDLRVEFGAIENIAQFLGAGPHVVPIADASLTLASGAVARLSGEVHWMARGESRHSGRVLRALWTWLRTRALADWCQRVRTKGLRDGLRIFTEGGAIFALASNVGEVRHLRYTMRLEDDLQVAEHHRLPRGTRIDGLKVFRYSVGGNPWRQLSELAVTVTPGGGRSLEAGTLAVDFNHMFRRFAAQLQIVRQTDLPTAMLDFAAIGLFMVRLALKIHFWSFRAPEYEAFDPARQDRRLPGPLSGLQMTRDEVVVAPANLRLPLTRYRKDQQPGKVPVLLIHGFGSSGIQYAHPRLEHNMVRHLVAHGHDVWVCELRTSIAVASSLSQWTLDEVAREDLPAIAGRILEVTGQSQLDVVAHCIGSAMFCTAVLAGRLAGLVRQAVLLQVGPLITLSKGNEFRGQVAGAMRRYLSADHVDSSIDSRADWQDVLLDRLLWTYPYPREEQARHTLWPPYRAHTHIANCNRSAAVFGRLFQHANLDAARLDLLGDLLGRTNLKTFEQTVQYAFVKRLTDYEACNAYVVDDNVRKYFDFPVRFLHGELNDVFHPQTTARSLQLLHDVFGDQHPADRIVLKGYGHLDPLIGSRAHLDVYPHIAAFLAAAPMRRQAAASITARYAKQALVGPVLGWLRQEDRRWVARIWCRTDDEHTYAEFLMAVVMKGGRAVPGASFWTPLPLQRGERRAPVDLVGTIDVPLPEGPPEDFEIVVAGAYASAESNMPPEVAAVERRGTYDRFAPRPDEKELLAAQAPRAGKLDDVFGQIVENLRAMPAWTSGVPGGEAAYRVCSDAYDAHIDSVRISRRLLERLDPAADRIDFAVGSCRYVASIIDRERADAAFAHLLAALDGADGLAAAPSLLLLVGDQIYADATAGLFDAKTRRARYYDAYREAWSAPHAREVLRRLPVYMMLDDHEICDGWHPQDPDDELLQAWALRAFEDYQLRMSPRALDAGRLARDEPQPPYHYAFEAAGFPFFVCDTRTDRQGDGSIVSEAQLDALKEWLVRHNSRDDRPKFVVSPSVVVPWKRVPHGSTPGRQNAYARRSDGWDGYPRSLHDLFGFIAGERIRNVVFLSGDAHFSMASRIWFEGAGIDRLGGLSIVSSPMYAPYPFANQAYAEFLPANDADPLALPEGVVMRYACDPASVATGDSFTLVSVKPNAGGWNVSTSTRIVSGLRRDASFELA